MAANDVTFRIGADFNDAQSEINKFGKSVKSSLSGIESSFGALKTIAGGFVAVFAGKQVINAFNAITDAAAEQQQAIAQLNTALKLSGDFSADASKQMQDFASALQSTSTVGDEVILQQLSLAKSFNLSNDAAQELVKAAVDLSAATGISLESAVKNLGKTYAGLTGELGEVIPALKSLTEEQLKSGAAVSFVRDRFGGAADSLTKTFAGATAQAKNQFGDLLEVLGSFIVENPFIIDGINNFSKTLISLGKTIKDNKGQVIAFVQEGLARVADVLEPVVRGFSAFIRVVSAPVGVINQLSGAMRNLTIEVAQFLLSFETTQDIVNAVKDSFISFFRTLTIGIAFVIDQVSQLPIVGEEFKKAGVDLEGFAVKVDEFGKSLDSNLGKDVTEPIRAGLKITQDANAKFVDDVDKGLKVARDGVDAAADSVKGLGDKIRGLNLDAKKAAEATGNIGKGAAAGAFDAGFAALDELLSQTLNFFDPANLGKKFEESIKALKPEDLIKAGITVAAAVGDAIASGAASFVKTVAGGFVKDLKEGVSVIGNFPQEILNIFQELDTILASFIDQLPGVLASFFEKVPELTNGIVKALGKFAEIIVENAPKIVATLVDAFLKLFDKVLELLPKLIDKLPEIFQKLVTGLVGAFEILLKRLPAIITSIFNALPEIVRTIVAAIPDIIEVFAQNIGPIVQAFVVGLAGAMDEIVIALVDELIIKGGIFRIAVALAQAFAFEVPKALAISGVEVFRNLGRNLYEGFAGAFGGLGPFFKQFGKDFSDNVKFEFKEPPFIENFRQMLENIEPKFIRDLRELLNKPLKGITGGGDGGIFGIPGTGGGGKSGVPGSPFASGGLVPSGFPGDSFPARLTSGELVIPRGDVGRLSEFLDDHKAEAQVSQPSIAQILDRIDQTIQKNVTINLRVGEQELANLNLNLARQGFRTA